MWLGAGAARVRGPGARRGGGGDTMGGGGGGGGGNLLAMSSATLESGLLSSGAEIQDKDGFRCHFPGLKIMGALILGVAGLSLLAILNC